MNYSASTDLYQRPLALLGDALELLGRHQELVRDFPDHSLVPRFVVIVQFDILGLLHGARGFAYQSQQLCATVFSEK